MEEIRIVALREIVRNRERVGEQTIPVGELLARLQLTPLVNPGELARLREIEALARKIVSTPLWELRGAKYDDAVALRRLVLDDSGSGDPIPSD